MSTQTIATRLTELCRQGEWETAQKELFAQDAISIEPENSGDFPKETKGLNAIIEKGHKWQSLVQEVHGITTSSPLVSGNTIVLKLAMDLTMKGRGRQKMEEICVYAVKNDKIISEQFFM